MPKLDEKQAVELIKKSMRNRHNIEKSEKCGCYNCMVISKSNDVYFLEELDGTYTGICPECGIDSLLDEKTLSGLDHQLTVEFLKEMNKHAYNNQ